MKFTNKFSTETVESILNGQQERLKNNFYKLQENFVFGTYYSIDMANSTVGEGHLQVESTVGSKSPLKYVKIVDMPIYGFSNIDINITRDEFGPEADTITGDIYVLEDTVIPVPEDRFTLNHLPNILFRVLSATSLKLEDGNSMYRLSYKIDNYDIKNTELISHVIETYNCITKNVGTDLKCTIKEKDFNLIERLEYSLSELRTMYLNAFYREDVDTLVLCHNDKNIYDAYLMEFIIDNRILDDESIELILFHQLSLPNDFKINYNRSIFNRIKNKNRELFKNNTIILVPIISCTSTFINSKEYFYEVVYERNKEVLLNTQSYKHFPDELELALKGSEVDSVVMNLILKFLDNSNLDEYDLELLENISIYNENISFYSIPILIYSIMMYINNILS